jgi:arylsulfatase A-like enzyme
VRVKRNVRRLAWALGLLVVCAGLLQCRRGDGRPERIILIVVDTLRRDHVSPYGSAVATPNLQRLADRGQVFSKAVASFHQTTMSMGALFSGRTPSLESGETRRPLPWNGRHWCGLARFAASAEDSCVPQGLITLAEDLERAGYWTVGVVSNRLLFRPAGYDQGFDEWIEVAADNPNQSAEVLARERSGLRVQAAVDEVLASLPAQPLFLYVHYMDVHDHALWGATYPEAVAKLDEQLGQLLERLESSGLLEDSVVLFTSDHGEILDEKFPVDGTRTHNGNPSFQPVLEIPLIVAPPHFEDTDALIRSQDVADLIRRVAGIEPAPAPEPALARDEQFTSERAYLTYRRGRFKSIFHRRRVRTWALFDLDANPEEDVNLIAEEREVSLQHLARVAELVKAFEVSARGPSQASEEDRARLRALGYLDD